MKLQHKQQWVYDMKAECIALKTTDGDEVTLIASEIEAICDIDKKQETLISMKSGLFFHITANTGAQLKLALQNNIAQENRAATLFITEQNDAIANTTLIGDMVMSVETVQPASPFIYAAGMDDESLVKWMEDLSFKIRIRQARLELIEDREQNLRDSKAELNEVIAEIDAFVRQK
ncbi:hypothetical protein CBW54_02460 [Yersinia kristensenii]|nr:hypothetical protein CBW54_02460 [Yersinia kristensenii]